MAGVAKRHDDALADSVCGFRIGRRQHDDEFLAAVPCDQIRLASVAAQNARSRLQNAVPRLLTETVVELLEVIQVNEGNAQGPFVARRVFELARQKLLE